MTLTYELVQRDFYEAFIAHRNRSAWTKWFLRFMVLVLILAIGSIVLGAVLVRDFHFAKNNAFSLLVLAVFWIFFLWGQPWLAAKNQFGKQPSAQGPRTMLLDGVGTHWKWNGGSADIEWKNFVRFHETKNQFLLYSSPACFNIIPKRALTADQINTFRKLVAENMLPVTALHSQRKLGPQSWILLAVVVIAAVLAILAIRNIRATPTREATTEAYISDSGSVGFDIQPLKTDEGTLRFEARYESQGKLAKFVIEFGPTQTVESKDVKNFPLSTGKGRFVAETGSDASVLLSDLEKALEAKAIPVKVQRVKALSFDFVNIGDNLSQAPGGGFNEKPPGGWTAIKVFIGKGDQEGEVFVNINPVIGKGQFSIKDPDYGDIVLRHLATVL
jgi:hypothetical protein